MTKRFIAVAAALTIASAAPRSAVSQAIPDKPAPAAPAAPAPAPDPASPAAPADTTKDVDAAGTYTTYLTAQGNAMTTVTTIQKNADGTYSGTVTGDGIPPLPVNTVTVKGNKIHLSITAPDGTEALIDMVLTGTDFTGSWSMANDGSNISGTKSP